MAVAESLCWPKLISERHAPFVSSEPEVPEQVSRWNSTEAACWRCAELSVPDCDVKVFRVQVSCFVELILLVEGF